MDSWDFLTTSAFAVGISFAALAALEPFRRPDLTSTFNQPDLPSLIRRVPGVLCELFDTWFGDRHLSRRCLSRTWIVSIAITLGFPAIFAFIVLVAVSMIYGTSAVTDMTLLNLFQELFGGYLAATAGPRTMPLQDLTLGQWALRGALVIPTIVVTNWITDYVSLGETRLVLAFAMRPGPQKLWPLALPGLMVADFVLSSVILGAGIAVLLGFLHAYQAFFGPLFLGLLGEEGRMGPLVALFYPACILSTVIWSLWSLLFALAAGASYAMAAFFSPIAGVTWKVIDRFRFPLVGLGLDLAIGVVAICFLVWAVRLAFFATE